MKICDDRVEALSEPRILRCPLLKALRGLKTIDREAVKKTVEAKNENVVVFRGRLPYLVKGGGPN